MVLSQSQHIVFTSSALFGYFLAGVVYILLPITAYLLMMRRKAARFYPVITGVIVYFIAERFSALFASLFGAAQGFMSKTVIAAEIICCFEELGRYFAMKYPVTDIKKQMQPFATASVMQDLNVLFVHIRDFRFILTDSALTAAGLTALYRASRLKEQT